MKIGVVFPQTEIGSDPAAIRDYAQAVEALGYTHILAFDSVVGANPDTASSWWTPSRVGGCAWASGSAGRSSSRRSARTSTIAASGSRNSSRSCACSDGTGCPTPASTRRRSSGRFRSGWGGESEAVLRRAARLADGWITLQTFRPGPAAQQTVDRLQGLVREAGRDPGTFGIEGRVALAHLPPEAWAKGMAAWRAMRGITHFGLPSPEEHVRTLERFKVDVLG